MLQNWVRSYNRGEDSINDVNLNSLGQKTNFLLNKFDPNTVNIAIIGSNPDASKLIRNQLYSFQDFGKKLNINDLGDSRNDNPDFLIPLYTELISNNIIPILIGQNDPLLKAQIISAYNSVGKANLSIFSSNMFTDEYLLSKPELLTSLQWLGKQIHQPDTASYEDCSVISLGQIRKNIQEIEPAIRNSNTFNFSLQAIRFPDAPAQAGFSASAMSLDEACQLMRYVGFNEQLTSIAFSHYLFQRDLNERSANSIAQLIWYLIEGISHRKYDLPLNSSSIKKYIVQLHDHSQEVNFIKSDISGRWWLECGPDNFKACSYQDYLLASENTLSERILNYLQES